VFVQGADILDVGGYSTRPGFADVPEAEELERVVPAVAALRRAADDARASGEAGERRRALISVDTFRPAVARAAAAAGADVLNDVSGGQHPDGVGGGMFAAAAELGAPLVVMDHGAAAAAAAPSAPAAPAPPHAIVATVSKI
jgi:dihydropteroate synthase